MKSLHCEILIDKPIDAVFALYADFHNYPKWSQYVDEVFEHNAPNCWTWKASAGPFPFELETEIVEMHPNELIVWRGWRSN
jgi:uncharacterized membrane protein